MKIFVFKLKFHWSLFGDVYIYMYIYIYVCVYIYIFNGLPPVRCQVRISTNDGLWLTEHVGTNISQISIKIQQFSFNKMNLKMSSAKCRPFFPEANVLIHINICHVCAYMSTSGCSMTCAFVGHSDKLEVPIRIPCMFNTLRQRQNGCHFPDDIFKRVFWDENV